MVTGRCWRSMPESWHWAEQRRGLSAPGPPRILGPEEGAGRNDDTPDWIAVDWGTSNLRAWACARTAPCCARPLRQGHGQALARGVRAHLRELIAAGPRGNGRPRSASSPAAWSAPARAGSRRPTPPSRASRSTRASPARPPAPDRDVGIIPGLSQAEPARRHARGGDQGRGLPRPEPWLGRRSSSATRHSPQIGIQVAARRGSWASHLAHVRAPSPALSGHTPCSATGHHRIGWDDWTAFLAGRADGLVKPEALAARLFSRAPSRFSKGLRPEAAKSRLSGLLIGTDLAAAKGWWLGQRGLPPGRRRARRTWRCARPQGVPARDRRRRGRDARGPLSALEEKP
jgi:2-dehydro-3-deoxygalactonokinase